MKLKTSIIIMIVGILIAATFEVRYAWAPARGMMFLAGFVRMALVGLFALSVAWVFTLWRKHKAKSLLPLALVLLFMFGGCDGAIHLGEILGRQRFLSRLAGFEHAARLIESGSTSSDPMLEVKQLGHGRQWVKIHQTEPYIGYAAVTDPETNGSLTIRFLQDITFNSHHRMFMFQSVGDFDGVLRNREYIHYTINTNWCATAD